MTKPAPTSVRTTTLAILSLLDEPPTTNSATRPLNGRSVLARTVDRVAAAVGVDAVDVLAWDDQVDAIGENVDVRVRSLGERAPTPAMLARAAALRWTDGWRGGPLGTTEFDRGFHADAIAAAMDDHAADNVLIVSPSAALVDADALGRVVAQLAVEGLEQAGFAFAGGAPGSGAMALRRDVLDELRRDGRSPGWLLTYHPDRARHDPLSRSPSIAVPPNVSRSTARLSVDSDRQRRRLSLAQADVDSIDAGERVGRLARHDAIDATPREVVVELTTRRMTKPIFSPLAMRVIDRADMTLDVACRIFDEIAAIDDVRLTLAGVGDPLLNESFGAILDAARSRGINAIHVETDLLVDRSADLVRGVDLVSVNLPALLRTTYAAAMGVDRLDDVMANVKSLLLSRGLGDMLPIVVPTFVKLAANVGEMEAWYDQWIRAFGGAAIVGPSDFGGAIAYAGVSDMTPPARVACRSLRSRVMVLSDGGIIACEQDVFARQALGNVASTSIADAWNAKMRPIRAAHAAGEWRTATPACGACRMWDRP